MRSWRPEACSRLSLQAGDPVAGTASTARGYLVLEHGGPWGQKALRDAPIPGPDGEPPGIGSQIQRALKPLNVTPLLARRPGARHGVPHRPTVMLVAVDHDGGRGVCTTVDSLRDVADWDLPRLIELVRAGELPPGWESLDRHFLVCVHARRDACCGELGRPLAHALAAVDPEHTWEVSHLGGHRLAANLLVLPDGVVYGRLDPSQAPVLAGAHARGRVLPDAMRGRAALSPPVQAAEIAVRRAAGADVATALQLVEEKVAGARTISHWAVDSRLWRVLVDTVPGTGPERPASCGGEAGPPPPRQVVVEVTDVEGPGRGAVGWDAAHAEARAVGAPHPVVVEAVAGLPTGTALDVATGTGRHAIWLAEKGWTVTGVDFSRTGLERAADEAEQRGVTVRWELGDARHWAPSEPVDLVLLAFVHLPAVLARAAQWLRPGGHLVVVGHAVRNRTDGVGGPQDARLLHDPSQLRSTAEAAGLTVLRSEEIERGDPPAIEALLVAVR